MKTVKVKCPQHMRHWFTERGTVGGYSDKCIRCGYVRVQISEVPKKGKGRK